MQSVPITTKIASSISVPCLQLSKHCIVCPLIYIDLRLLITSRYLPKKGTPLKNGDGLVFDKTGRINQLFRAKIQAEINKGEGK
jgi:hypothetical protein